MTGGVGSCAVAGRCGCPTVVPRGREQPRTAAESGSGELGWLQPAFSPAVLEAPPRGFCKEKRL